MIGYVIASEHESDARRENCIVCLKPCIPHEVTDVGPVCRSCAEDATEIRVDYVINGRILPKTLKPTRLRSVPAGARMVRPEKTKADAVNAGLQKGRR